MVIRFDGEGLEPTLVQMPVSHAAFGVLPAASDGGPECRSASRSQTTLLVALAPGRSCRVMMVPT
jgi:hypothetical protein